MICISSILDPADISSIKSLIDDENDQDGILTAGFEAQKIKNNIQQFKGDAIDYASNRLSDAFNHSIIFQNYAFPKQYSNFRIARYKQGMFYGRHIDNVVQSNMRTDLSFTLFLSDIDDYDGGILKVYEHENCKEIKLSAGDIVIYPTDSLHEITPVTRGERIVIIGWIQSRVRDPYIRNILFDMAQSRDLLWSYHQETSLNVASQKIAHAFNRLYRLHCDV